MYIVKNLNSMDYNYKAKPTLYNGITFRSILEARWAAFFDLVGWKYQYEPFEIGGRLPDFILYCSGSGYNFKQVIAEVKPEAFCNDEFYKSLCKSYKGYPAMILVLNENPFSVMEERTVKLGNEVDMYSDVSAAETLHIDPMCMKCVNDFSSYYMMWDGVMEGTVQRKDFIIVSSENSRYSEKEMDYRELLALWKEAGNRVQFKSY